MFVKFLLLISFLGVNGFVYIPCQVIFLKLIIFTKGIKQNRFQVQPKPQWDTKREVGEFKNEHGRGPFDNNRSKFLLQLIILQCFIIIK